MLESPGYGLLDNVTWLTPDPAGHWQGGIQYDADCPAGATTVSVCFPGITGDPGPKVPTWLQLTRGSRAFTVYDRVDCSPPGNGLSTDALDEMRADALMALSKSAPRNVERTFWRGNIDNAPGGGTVFPNLTTAAQTFDGTGRIIIQPAGTLITGGVDVVEGLGRLEAAIANCLRSVAWIHVPVILAASLSARGMLTVQNGKLYTYAGNRVIVGRGYDDTYGQGGAANAAGTTQMWATSPVFGLRSQPRAFTGVEILDRTTNTIKAIAEQTFLLGWQCCLIGITVTTGGLVSSGFGSAT
jgi:hypothetical protein